MSLHAQLSPAALERLRKQRRNSTVTSFLIALLAIVFAGLLLALWLLPALREERPELIAYAASSHLAEQVERKQLDMHRHKPSAPSSVSSNTIAANSTSTVSIPVPDMELPTMSQDFGMMEDFGEGWGESDGLGTASGFAAIPASMKARCSRDDRLQRLVHHGGSEACEDAVVKGLRWLKKTQRPDGSWADRHTAAMTGLSILAFLGHCETPLSEEFGDSVTRAIGYLVDYSMKNNGYLTESLQATSGCYEHAISAYALAEAYTFCSKIGIEIPHLRETVERAVHLILENQHDYGSWDYRYDTKGKRGGDVSIVGWHVQALKAARHTGIDFPGLDSAGRRALDYLASKQAKGGGFGYTGQRPNQSSSYFSLTGVGMLCFQMWDRPNAAEVRRGAEYVLKHGGIDWESGHGDLYAAYYDSQAMIHRGGSEWDAYNAMFRDAILANQLPDGSWPPTAGAKHSLQNKSGWGLHYRTTLCILMLEVYYRFLPGTGAGMP